MLTCLPIKLEKLQPNCRSWFKLFRARLLSRGGGRFKRYPNPYHNRDQIFEYEDSCSVIRSANRMNWRMRNDLRGSFITSVGWLFADLLLVLTMIFLASSAFSFQTPPPPPCIKVSTQSLSFAATQGQSNPAPQRVTLTNCGPAGDWSASSANNSSWLSTNPTSGHLDANAKQD